MKAEFLCHYVIILEYLMLYMILVTDIAFFIVLISIINLVINFDENQYNTKTDTRQKIKS